MREEEAAALGNSQELGLSFAADTDVEAEGNALAGMTADAARRNAQADSPLAEIVMLPGWDPGSLYLVLNCPGLASSAFADALVSWQLSSADCHSLLPAHPSSYLLVAAPQPVSKAAGMVR